MASIKPSKRWYTYQDIRSRCHLIGTERSTDYMQRRERWKHGDIIYTVLLKVNPVHDRVLRITGRVRHQEAV